MRNLILALLCCLSLVAHAAPDPAAVRQLAAEDSDDKIAAIRKIALTAEPEALAVLQQLADGSLKDDKGEDITINNRVRRELEGALAVLKLIDPDATVRFAAVKEIAGNADAAMAPMPNPASASSSVSIATPPVALVRRPGRRPGSAA